MQCLRKSGDLYESRMLLSIVANDGEQQECWTYIYEAIAVVTLVGWEPAESGGLRIQGGALLTHTPAVIFYLWSVRVVALIQSHIAMDRLIALILLI